MRDHLDDRTYDLLFGIRRSVRYHDRRRRFYESWNTFTVFVATVGSSAAVAAFLAAAAPPWLAAIAAAVVAVTAAADLAVGTARRADRHGDLARQFFTLERRFVHDKNLTNDEYAEIVDERLRIEATEPPTLRLLDALCHFEVLRSLGHDPSLMPRVPWVRRIAAQGFSQAEFAVRLGAA